MPVKDSEQVMSLYEDHACRHGVMGHNLSGKKPREKKQMHFQSRKQMLRYIENFKLNYKTQLCRNFMDTGACEFNDDCAYAHGYCELIVKPSPQCFNKNYKTKMCKQWHEQTPGLCTYGEKCQFIHDEDVNEITCIKAMAEEKQHNLFKQQIEKQLMARPMDEFGSSCKQKQYVQKNRLSNGLNNGLAGASAEVTVSEFDSNQMCTSVINPFSAGNCNVDEYQPPYVKITPFNHLKLVDSQRKGEGFPQLAADNIDAVQGHNVGDIYTQSTFRDININNMLQGGTSNVQQNSLEQLVRGPHFNKGLLGEIKDNIQEDNGVFHIFNGNNEVMFSPQLARFESKTFKQIEENIQKEILDYSSSCEDQIAQSDPSLSDNCAEQQDGTVDSLQQSTMTNSESPSPKKEENNHDYSFSAASEDETDGFDNVEVNAALKDLNPSKLESSLVEDDQIGKNLMDRKRLRIFANITKKKTEDMSMKIDKTKVNSFLSGSFLEIKVQKCQYLDE